MKIEINKDDIQNAETFIKGFGKEGERAIIRSMNRAIMGVRTDSVKAVKQEYNVKPTAVRKSFQIQKAKGNIFQAIAIASGNRIPLINFGARPNKPGCRKPAVGVRVKVKKTPKVLKHSFVARMRKSGHVGIFQRLGKDRLPIDQKFGPAIPQMLGNPQVRDEIRKNALSRLSKNLNHEIDFALQKMGAK